MAPIVVPSRYYGEEQGFPTDCTILNIVLSQLLKGILENKLMGRVVILYYTQPLPLCQMAILEKNI